MSGTTVLVTGSSGFLGAEIVRQASTHGFAAVREFRRSGTAGAGVFLGDLSGQADLDRACQGADIVIHSAGLAHVFGPGARDAARFNTVNEQGAANAAQAALNGKVRRFVLISSVSVYGGSRNGGSERSTTEPKGPYAVSKLAGERAVSRILADSPVELVILRMATIYGEGDRGNVAKLIDAIRRGRFAWIGDGGNRKSLIHKTDAASACLLAAKPGTPQGIFNVSAPPCTMKEVVESICLAAGVKMPPIRIPLWILRPPRALLRAIGDPGRMDDRLDKFLANDDYNATGFCSQFDFVSRIAIQDGIRRQVSGCSE